MAKNYNATFSVLVNFHIIFEKVVTPTNAVKNRPRTTPRQLILDVYKDSSPRLPIGISAYVHCDS